MLSVRIVSEEQSGRGGGDPQTAAVIDQQPHDRSVGQPVRRREADKLTRFVSNQTTLIKPEPKISGFVLRKRRGGFRFRQAVLLGEGLKSFSLAVPPAQTIGGMIRNHRIVPRTD